jgi:hypothetical protein
VPESFFRPVRKPTRNCDSAFCNLEFQQARRPAKKIESLRRERNQADYELRQPRCERPSFAKRQVLVARGIAAGVDECGAEPTWSDFRRKVREYAENVLRIEISNGGEQ